MFSIKLFNTKIDFCFSFFAVVTLVSLFDGTSYILLGILCCLLHELGHISAMCIFNVPPKKIQFYGAGIKITVNEKMTSFQKELIIEFAGCITNILIFLSLYFFSNSFKVKIFATMNLIIGLFNLLPFKNFDGGKITDLILDTYSTKSRYVLRTIVRVIAIAFLSIVGIIFYINNEGNISLFVSIIYIIISELFL